jgi:hypothetical protein
MAGASNFPNGFPGGVTIRGVPIQITNPGKVFWLYNGAATSAGVRSGSDGNRGDFNSPFATLAGASGACTAGRGDIIMVKSGHAETISSATAAALSVAGVAVVGLGTGLTVPKFTIDTANTATIAVSAANISFTNCQFVANFLSIAACFTLTTAKWFTLQNCRFTETSNVLDFLNIVKSTGAANTIDGLTITDCSWVGLGTTSVGSLVLTANDVDQMTLLRNRVNLARTADTSILAVVSAGVLTGLDCGDNVVISKQTATTAGSLINVGGTTSTGAVYRNFAGTLTTASDKLFTTTVGLYPFENRVSGVVGATGFVIPAVDS